MQEKVIRKAFRAAYPWTIPILAGFMNLGMAYGIYMNVSGFDFWFPLLMSLTVFAGSMQFVAVGLLLGPFEPLKAFMLTLMINARHLFYGLSMLDKYNVPGLKRYYLIFGMCDETFSINCTADVPPDVDRGWFMFFVTLLNQIYWVVASTIGGLFGSLIQFDTTGLEFVMTALFVVIFLEQWMKEETHYSSLLGLGLSLLCLIIFGGSNFIIPSMCLLLAALMLLKKPLEKAGESN